MLPQAIPGWFELDEVRMKSCGTSDLCWWLCDPNGLIHLDARSWPNGAGERDPLNLAGSRCTCWPDPEAGASTIRVPMHGTACQRSEVWEGPSISRNAGHACAEIDRPLTSAVRTTQRHTSHCTVAFTVLFRRRRRRCYGVRAGHPTTPFGHLAEGSRSTRRVVTEKERRLPRLDLEPPPHGVAVERRKKQASFAYTGRIWRAEK